MPILHTKPRHITTRIEGVATTFNSVQHHGKRVRLITGKYRGHVGKIITAVMANPVEGAKLRGVYYAVELPEVIVDAVTWEDFLWLAH